MADQSQLEKDIAALRSHVIDGIEELKGTSENISTAVAQTNRLLGRLVGLASLIAILLAIYVIRHW